MTMKHMSELHNKLYGGIYGLLIGDALGVPYEFKSSNEIQDIDLFPQNLKNKTYPQIPFGTWSDDGSQSLILLTSLLKNNDLDLTDFLEGLVKWLDEGYMAVDNKVFDVGIQTNHYLHLFKKTKKFVANSSPSELENGNGSLMRCLPLALWHTGSNEELVQFAQKQSIVTHPHIRSQICCAWYCLIARELLLGQEFDSAMTKTKNELIEIYQKTHNTIALDELHNHILSYDVNKCSGSGYVVDSLMTVFICLREQSYADIVKKAVSFGNDTDTTACIAGGLAGIKYGFSGIPEQWLSGLRAKQLVEPLISSLLSNFEIK